METSNTSPNSERVEKARALFSQGYNCCQAVAGAFADLFSMDTETMMRACDGFGGGMGRMRSTCGAVSAMVMLVGLKLSSGKPGDPDNRTMVYTKVREVIQAFQEKNGSVICGELLGTALPKDNSARPEERTAQYYQKRPCSDYVGDCAGIIEKHLLA